jgi:hypothetical protein
MFGKTGPFLPSLGKMPKRPAAKFANVWQIPPFFAEPWQNRRGLSGLHFPSGGLEFSRFLHP